MAVASGSLVVAERHSRLVRLDPRSGEQLWEQRVEDCWGTAVIASECCLYLSQSGVLHCFDLGNGLRLWSTPGMSLRYYVSVCGSVVWLGGWRGYHSLMRVALTDGRCLPFDGAAVCRRPVKDPHRRPFTAPLMARVLPVDGQIPPR
ncbi:outer membrane protein assembly factor BamB family protein [Micromonospora echinofusca]|uniref:outer membrane protein assembly factor BamB family protein n=1 Tax=Micromonospora echinofusca TaxID=47858 RepID=UPI000B5ACA94